MMSTTSDFAPRGTSWHLSDRVLVGIGVRLIAWGRRRAERRSMAYAATDASAPVPRREAAEQAATDRAVASHFGIR